MPSKNPPTNRLESGLYVVATPIGNLGDLSDRAKNVLCKADFIYAEDTRRSKILLSHIGSDSPIRRLDENKIESKISEIIAELESGKSLALVCDAGTPGVNDPASRLIVKLPAEIKTIPIPGPSAVLALHSVASFSTDSFNFRGFFPRKDKEISDELNRIQMISAISDCIFYWFESPRRILSSLKKVKESFPSSNLLLGKELTKLHEKIFRGTSVEVYEMLENEIKTEGELGEFLFALELKSENFTAELASNEWEKALGCALLSGSTVSEASKQVSRLYGVSKKVVYQSALKISEKKI